VAQRSTGYVLAGNHTYAAMAAEGMESCLVDWFEGSDEEALEVLRDDNATSDLASYDQQALDALLEGLPSADLSIDVAAVDLTPSEPAVSEDRPRYAGKLIDLGDGRYLAGGAPPAPDERDPSPVRVVAALPHWARSEVYAILDARARQGETRGQTLLRLLRSAS
jgi:hypothetical protein